MIERALHVGGRGESLRTVFFERLEDEFVQVRVDARDQLDRRNRILQGDVLDRLELRIPAERMQSRHHHVEQHAEREQIATPIERQCTELFRRQVRGFPFDHALGTRDVQTRRTLGHAEVGDLREATGRNENVARRDVAMDQVDELSVVVA